MPNLPDDQLLKAAANLGRIADFVSGRSSWQPPPETVDSLEHLVTASRTLSGTVASLGGNPDPAVLEPLPASDPGAVLEAARVERFAAYLEEVDRWFKGLEGATPSEPGYDTLNTIATAVAGIGVAIEHILATRSSSAVNPGAPAHPPAEVESALDASPDDGSTVVVPSGPGSRLVLEDTEETPLLQTFKGNVELTHGAQEAIRSFLATNAIELNSYETRKLEHKIQRWIEATPEGQSLVLKIGWLSGSREPYPSYVSREMAREVPPDSASS